MVYTIYALVDPRDCSTYYVGCSADVEKRYMAHCQTQATCGAHKRNKELRGLGLKPGLVIIGTANEAYTAALLETQTIDRLESLGHKLMNRKRGNNSSAGLRVSLKRT